MFFFLKKYYFTMSICASVANNKKMTVKDYVSSILEKNTIIYNTLCYNLFVVLFEHHLTNNISCSEDDFVESARKLADDVPETTIQLMYQDLQISKAALKNGEIEIAKDIDNLGNAQGKKIMLF